MKGKKVLESYEELTESQKELLNNISLMIANNLRDIGKLNEALREY